MSEQITTVEQLAALPMRTVLRAKSNELGQIGMLPSDPPQRVLWTEGWAGLADAIEWFAPLTVLYRPDLPPQDELAADLDKFVALFKEAKDMVEQLTDQLDKEQS